MVMGGCTAEGEGIEGGERGSRSSAVGLGFLDVGGREKKVKCGENMDVLL